MYRSTVSSSVLYKRKSGCVFEVQIEKPLVNETLAAVKLFIIALPLPRKIGYNGL